MLYIMLVFSMSLTLKNIRWLCHSFIGIVKDVLSNKECLASNMLLKLSLGIVYTNTAHYAGYEV